MAETYAQAATRVQQLAIQKGLTGTEKATFVKNKLLQEGWIDAQGNRTKKGAEPPPAPQPKPPPAPARPPPTPAKGFPPDFVGPIPEEKKPPPAAISEEERKRLLEEARKRNAARKQKESGR